MRLGNTTIASARLGNNAVQAVYLGNNLVWQNAPVATAATGVGVTSFTANWNAYTGALYYLLDVSTSSTFATFVYQNQPVYAPTTSYVVIGLQSNTTYYYRVRASDSFDSDAQAFFDRVTAATGTLSNTEKTAVNTLVLQMKFDGTWTPMKAIYPMVGASAAACAQNLKSSSFTGTFSSGWTFASTGVTGNGTSAYFDTGLNASTDLTLSTNHFSYYSRTSSVVAVTVEMGVFQSAFVHLRTAVNYVAGGVSSLASFTTTTTSAGFWLGSKTANNSRKAIYNGSVQATSTVSDTTAYPNLNFYIEARNDSGSAAVFSDKQCALASIGDGLDDTQASKFYTSVEAFQVTLSRNVVPQIVSDADAQAYINRVYTAGGRLTNTEANAVNQLTIDMKAAGIWTAMKAVYPMVGASAAACSQNLKSSSFTGSFTATGWTFASTGVTPNPAFSAYMDTGMSASGQLSTSSAHMSSYNNTAPNNGMLLGNGDLTCLLQYSGPTLYGGLAGSFISSSASQSASFTMVNRPNSTTLKIIRNSTILLSSSSNSGVSYTSANIDIGRYGAGFYQDSRYAFASIGDGLTDTQAADLYNAVQIMNTTLSRQV